MTIDSLNDFGSEQIVGVSLGSGNAKAMLDIFPGLCGIEGSQLRAKSDSLFELTEPNGIQLLIQFGLPDQHDLQQFIVSRLEVREEAYLFE